MSHQKGVKMTIFRLVVALSIVVSLAVVLTDQALASTHVWIVMSLPSSPPFPGSTFTTDLKISSWNGAAAALDLTVHYDPAVLKIVDFSTPSVSEFYPDCFADSASYTSGQTRIACFQVTNWEAQDPPVSFGTLTWQVVGAACSATDVVIEPISLVDARWRPVEVIAYGQRIVIATCRVYLPLILRNR